MTDMTTGSADASGDAGEPDNYKAKYDGLQRAFNKRHDEFTTTSKALETATERQAELEAELSAYRARDAEANQEERDRQAYEALRTRFEEEPPSPLRHNERRDTGAREDKPDMSVAWPV